MLLLLALLPAGAAAQNHDMIHLKNGSAVRGIIEGKLLDGSLRITDTEGDTFVFREDEIASITWKKNIEATVESRAALRQRYYGDHKGYMGMLDLGGGTAIDEVAGIAGSATIVNGYQFRSGFFIGVGVGLNVLDNGIRWEEDPESEYYSQGVPEEALGGGYTIPVFLQLQADLSKRKIAPYIRLRAGYQFITPIIPSENGLEIFRPTGLTADYNNEPIYSASDASQLYVEPSVGIHLNKQKKAYCSLGIGYKLPKPCVAMFHFTVTWR